MIKFARIIIVSKQIILLKKTCTVSVISVSNRVLLHLDYSNLKLKLFVVNSRVQIDQQERRGYFLRSAQGPVHQDQQIRRY